MADWKKIISTYAPLIPAVAVAAAVMIGLSGYETPTYAVTEYSTEESINKEISKKITQGKEKEAEIGTGAFDVPDGTYQGSGTGYGGTVTVSVTIQDKTITAIDILSHADTPSFFSRAQSQVVAAILSGQTADVDGVSGATLSSNGIKQAVRNALHVAAGEDTEALSAASGSSSSGGSSTSPVSKITEPSSYKDGTYTGSGVGWSGAVTTVQVTVSGGKIASIGVVSYGDTTSYFLSARDRIISAILAGQTTNVDTVSGATFSSNGLITAVRNALAKAAGENVDEPEESDDSGVEEIDETGVTYKDGTYIGKADGFEGEMEIEVVVEDGKIKSITILSSDDTEEYLENAETLIDEIISGQTTNVDTVSGATFSSKGIINAVRNALEEAKTESDDSDESTEEKEKMVFDYEDGIYVGVGEGYNDDIILGLTIRDKTLVAITVLYNDDTPAYFRQAQDIIRTVVNTQNTEVDAVSGATFSSEGIIDAIADALANAEKGITILDIYEEKDDSSGTDSSSVSDNDPDDKSGDSSVDTSSDDSSSDTSPDDSSSVSDNDPDDSSGDSSVDTSSDDSSSDTSSDDSSSDTSSDDSSVDTSADTSSADSSADDSSDTSSGDSVPEPDTNVFNNGTFTGTALCAADEDEDFYDYDLTLSIKIQDDKVTAVTDITGDGDSFNDDFIERAATGTKKITGTVAQILTKGSADGIDSVSGATCSSKAIIAAVQNAMEKARK